VAISLPGKLHNRTYATIDSAGSSRISNSANPSWWDFSSQIRSRREQRRLRAASVVYRLWDSARTLEAK
jgi:hypothetical protein